MLTILIFPLPLTAVVEELVYWLDGHLNQCVLIAMELHWTLAIHEALVSPKPIEQLNQKG